MTFSLSAAQLVFEFSHILFVSQLCVQRASENLACCLPQPWAYAKVLEAVSGETQVHLRCVILIDREDRSTEALSAFWGSQLCFLLSDCEFQLPYDHSSHAKVSAAASGTPKEWG